MKRQAFKVVALVLVLVIVGFLDVGKASARNVVVVQGGGDSFFAIRGDNTVWAWGDNDEGKLGIKGPETENVSTKYPVRIPGFSDVVKISGGECHTLAIKSDGTVWACGRNDWGQLGDGTTTSRGAFVQVQNLSGVVDVATGYTLSFALKSDGTVWGWGNNYEGYLGDGTTTTRKNPVQVKNLTGVIAVAAGRCHSLALKSDGTVWAWGCNNYGELGDGTTIDRNTPVQVKSPDGSGYLTDMIAIAAGSCYSLALKSDGTVWAWGNNGCGQLGDGTTVDRYLPVQVQRLCNVTKLVAGSSYAFATKSDGTVWAWGWNRYGQLGDGTTTNRTVPVEVPSLSQFKTIVATSMCSFGVKSDGIVWYWGRDWYSKVWYRDEYDYHVTPVKFYDFSVVAAAPGVEWTKGIGYDSSAKKLWKTQDGGYVLAATLYKDWNGTYYCYTPALIKLDSKGNIQWSKEYLAYLGADYGYAYYMTPTSDGGYAIICSVVPDYISGRVIPMLIKTDGEGNFIWKRNYGFDGMGENGICGSYVHQTSDGGLILMGNIYDDDIWDSNKIFVIKTDSYGGEVWRKYISTGDRVNEGVKSVQYTPDGGYIIASGFNDGCLIKIDGQGNVLWTKSLGGVRSVTLTRDGGYIAAGSSGVTKMDAQGNVIWSFNEVSTYSCAYQNSEGNYIVCGSNSILKLDSLGSKKIWEKGSNIGMAVNDILETMDGGYLLAAGNSLVKLEHDSVEQAAISVTPSSAVLAPGQTQQLHVTVVYPDGSTQDVTDQASYQSDNTSVVTVSTTGLITAVSPGTANITVTYQGKTATVPVTVAQPSTVLQQGDIIVLKDPERLIPVTYNCAAGFTVTENGVNVPVVKVEVKDGTNGWPFSEIWLYLEHSVTMGSNVVVSYNADPEHPITPAGGGTATIPVNTTVVNYSTQPFTIERSTITVPSTGDVVYVNLPTAVKYVEYTGDAGFVIHTGTVTIPITRVVAEGTQVKLYTTYKILAGETISVTYTPVVNYEIKTVSGTPLVVTTKSVTVVNQSEAPLTFYDPVVSSDGRTITMNVPADLGSVSYEGNAGFHVYSNGREIPVVKVEVDGNKIILYLGAPLIGGQSATVSYSPVPEAVIKTVGGTTLTASDNIPVNSNSSQASVVNLIVDVDTLNLPQGRSHQIVVTAVYSDGSTKDVTAEAAYQSDNPSVASVSDSGVVTGNSQGTANITVTYGGKAVTIPVTVTAPVLQRISVSPEQMNVAAGKTGQLKVTAYYSDGSTKDVTAQASFRADDSTIADVTGAGLVTGKSPGNTKITVSFGGMTAISRVQVSEAVLESISVQPASVELIAGRTQQLTVTAKYSDGTAKDVTGLSSYQTSSRSVALVSETGQVKGVSKGSAVVSATFGGKTATVPVSVSAPVVESLTVQPASVNLVAGRTQQLTVIAKYSDGSAQDVTNQASYQSDSASIAAVSSSGLVAGKAQGSANVTVAYEGKTVVVPVAVSAPVVESISVQPTSVSIPAGKTQQLTVIAKYSDGSTQDVTSQASYQSGNTSVAVVSETGAVTGVARGTAAVTVAYEGRTAAVPVSVSEAVLESISVAPASVNLVAGRTQQLTVTARYSDGSVRDVTNNSSYQTSNRTVAVVSETGLIKGVSKGSANIIVSFGSKNVTVPVSVSAPVVESVQVQPNPLKLYMTNSQRLRVYETYSDGSTLDVTQYASFSSGDTSIVRVSANGLATGVKEGKASVRVTYKGRIYEVPAEVLPIEIIPPPGK